MPIRASPHWRAQVEKFRAKFHDHGILEGLVIIYSLSNISYMVKGFSYNTGVLCFR